MLLQALQAVDAKPTSEGTGLSFAPSRDVSAATIAHCLEFQDNSIKLASVNITLLAAQWIGVLLVAGLLYVLAGNRA